MSGYGMYSSIHSVKVLKDLNDEAKQLDNEGKLPIPYKFYTGLLS